MWPRTAAGRGRAARPERQAARSARPEPFGKNAGAWVRSKADGCPSALMIKPSRRANRVRSAAPGFSGAVGITKRGAPGRGSRNYPDRFVLNPIVTGVPRPWPPAPTGKASCAFRSSPVPSRSTRPLPIPKRSASTRSIGILVTASSTRVLLRFETRWWVDKRMDLADLTYVWRGAAELMVGEAIAGRRDEVFLVTKDSRHGRP